MNLLGIVAAFGAADSLSAPVLVLAGNGPSVLIQEPPENWIALSKRTLLQECHGGEEQLWDKRALPSRSRAEGWGAPSLDAL